MNLMTVLPKLTKQERQWLENIVVTWVPQKKRLSYPVSDQALMLFNRGVAIRAAEEAWTHLPREPYEKTLLKKLKEDYDDQR